MNVATPIARALALAFLAGSWNRADLLKSGRAVFDERPRWLPRLIEQLLDRFSQAPHDAYEELVRAIEVSPSFRLGLSRWPRPSIAKLITSEPKMGVQRWPVPALCTSVELAEWLELSVSELDWLCDVRGLNGQRAAGKLQHYSFAWVAKRRGGHRLLEAPKSQLKQLQRRALRDILAHVPVHGAAHGRAPDNAAAYTNGIYRKARRPHRRWPTWQLSSSTRG